MADDPKPGLRERKRIETRARLIEAALKLFVKKGFEATTLDEIAEAAGISRRTFFHYFESKEDLALSWLDESTDSMAAAVALQDPKLPPLAMALAAIQNSAPTIVQAEAWAQAKLIQETPALRDRSQTKYVRLEAALAAAIAAHKGMKKDDLKIQLAAMTAAGALRVASQRWYESGGKEDLILLGRKIVKALES